MNEEAQGVEAPEVEANALAANEDAQVSESSTEEQSEAVNEGEADPAEAKGEEANGTPDGVQKRINEITRERRKAERRADRAEERLKKLSAQSTDEMEYEDALAHKTLNVSRREQAEESREAARELAQEAYAVRVEAASQKYSDYQQVTGNPNLTITPAMAEAILDSDAGPDVAYHLGKNPSEALRISKLNPSSQVRELGKLEAQISAPKAVKAPAAAPVKPVGAKSSGGTKDPTKMTMAEYVAWREGK